MESTNFKNYIVDIETKPRKELVGLYTENIEAPKNWKDKEKIDGYLSKALATAGGDMQLDIDYADILCIGIMDCKTKEKKFVTLEEFDKLLNDECTLITYNGKGFDIPILIRALLRTGLTKNVKWLKSSCKKWSNFPQIDLMEVICDFGKWKGLDELCRIYLGTGKHSIDFATASEEEIKKHNQECLETTYELYNFFKPIVG